MTITTEPEELILSPENSLEAIQQEVVRLRAENAQLRELANLATRDHLTGILNRRGLDEHISNHIALADRHFYKNEDYKGTLLLLDLDNFKGINETCGKIAGDKALKLIAQIAKDSLRRSNDIVGRWGGDEFVIYLPETGVDGGYQVAQRLRQILRDRQGEFHTLGLTTGQTTSIGIVHLQPHHDFTSLIDEADRALSLAKNAGKNLVSINGKIVTENKAA